MVFVSSNAGYRLSVVGVVTKQVGATVPLHCKQCKAPAGHVTRIGSRLYLWIGDGGLLANIGIRRCPLCGQVFHWDGRQHKIEDGRLLTKTR